MTQHRTTTIAVSIHPPGESPVFSEQATHVRLEDDGGGPFIVVKQCHPEIEPGEVQLDLPELVLVLETAQQLLGQL